MNPTKIGHFINVTYMQLGNTFYGMYKERKCVNRNVIVFFVFIVLSVCTLF